MQIDNWKSFRHLAVLAMVSAIASCGGGGSTSSGAAPGGAQGGGAGVTPPSPVVTIAATKLESSGEVNRFMQQAAFGVSTDDLVALTDSDATDWVRAEFSKSATFYLPTLLQRAEGGDELKNRPHSNLFWEAMINGDDALRQRMVFALSQIIVISDNDMSGHPLQVAYFMDILSNNAFGNYRDLLQQVTYSPAMSEYLTYLRNRKGDESTGRMPDENYARELMQLFTIGLVELNMDGTEKVGGDGRPIETYDNDDVVGLARVFTGLSLEGTDFWKTPDESRYKPLQMYQDYHSTSDKTFLTTTIPASTLGDDAVDMALDEIFAHPNLAPFISRQLIQRFTASNPESAYVQRVATAFETGLFSAPDGSSFGAGVRGDLQATLAAILLDATVHQPADQVPNTGGKVREPVLKFVQWARTFNVTDANVAEEGRLRDARSPSSALGQHPFRSPSVFNFYRPGFVAPGTESGAANLTAPELQIVNGSSSVGFVNFSTDFVFARRKGQDGETHFVPDYSDEVALADDPSALVDHLDDILTGSRMSPATKSDILAAISSLEISDSDADNDRLKRVRIGVLMAMDSSAYAVVQ